MKSLIGLTSSKEISIKKAAAACIAASTELAEIHPEMRKKELLETVVSLLAVDEPPEVQDEAAFTVANLARDFALKSDIRKAGGIKALVKLLPSTDPDVKKNVALALSSLLEDFTNRSEIRYVNGLAPLLELLGADFPEIQENTLMSLILSAEDHANRVEIRKLNGVKRLIDMLSQDLPELHHWTLTCLSKCLEDTETVNIFPDIGGLPPVLKMLSSEDVRNKRNASLVLSKAAKTDRNQNFIRDAGALPILIATLGHADFGAISHAAMALGCIAKNELTQLELNKVGVLDTLIKLIAHEDVDICRQATFALSSLCLNAKARLKIKTTESIGSIMRLLTLDDPQTLVNAAECIANLAEDTANRLDIVKLGGVTALLAVLSKPETNVQASACLAIARCMQEGEARISLTKDKKVDNIAKLISLVLSKDVSVARNAAYALSNAAQYELNAVMFCQMGAIEALLALGKDPAKSSQKFSHDALDKLLNYHLSAKYWLRNELSSDNLIKTGFYDLGSAGNNLENITGLPSLVELKSIPLDKRREIITIDHEKDSQFQFLCQAASQNLSSYTPRQQIRQIATIVSAAMGGPVEPAALSEFSFKFKVSELKLKAESNVLLIGQIATGTFYHRALLFKAICDKIGLGPCHLVRGDYNRAWNVVDVRKLEFVKERAPSAASGAKKMPPSRELPVGGLASAATPVTVQSGQSVLPVGWQPPQEPIEFPEEVTIVDLMFEPGRLIGVSSSEAIAYKSPAP
ncbi:armadillo-type protein [Obelidium mucronatum]|nr:armadillo-type protein [Obelidium mucronatum]